MDLVCNPEFLFYRTEMSLLATKDTVRLLPGKFSPWMDFHNRKRGIYLTLDYKAKAPKIDRNGVEMEVQSRYEDRHVK